MGALIPHIFHHHQLQLPTNEDFWTFCGNLSTKNFYFLVRWNFIIFSSRRSNLIFPSIDRVCEWTRALFYRIRGEQSQSRHFIKAHIQYTGRGYDRRQVYEYANSRTYRRGRNLAATVVIRSRFTRVFAKSGFRTETILPTSGSVVAAHSTSAVQRYLALDAEDTTINVRLLYRAK